MDVFINSLIAYFVMVDPIGGAIVFNALTLDKDKSYIKQMACRSVVISLIVVICFGLFGKNLLSSLGIEMDSFKIAGGLLVFYSAFGMITDSDQVSENKVGGIFEDISVFPMTVPLLAGPGCLSLTVLLFSENSIQGNSLYPLLAAIIFIYGITLTCLLFSQNLVKLIGKTANNVFRRLLGVLLAALAVQFITDGIKGLFPSL